MNAPADNRGPKVAPASPASTETYRQQIQRMTQSMVRGEKAALEDDLGTGYLAIQMEWFVDGNFEKRYDKLTKQMDAVTENLSDMEELVIKFIKAVPMTAYDSGPSDAKRFLNWLKAERELSPELLDYVAYQLAYFEVEEIARVNRLRHVHFQDLAGISEQMIEEAEFNNEMTIHLNPIRSYATFHTEELLDEGAELPTDVVLFPAGDEVATAVLEEDGKLLLNQLGAFAPCTLGQWAALVEDEAHDRLRELMKDMAAMGLIAFG